MACASGDITCLINQSLYTGSSSNYGKSVIGVGEVNDNGIITKPSTVNTSNNTDTNIGSTTAENWKAGAAVVGAVAGLANAWLGYKNYKLAKEEFGFQKNTTNRNLHNQALLINEQLDRRTLVGNALAGRTLTEKQKQERVEATKRRHVDGSAIG
jgi:hypothetical protein